jgi:hypothetical protein
LTNGEKLTHFVEKSLGNIHRPLTDAHLNAKFRDQAVLALPLEQAEKLLDQCWRIDQLSDVNQLIKSAIP